MRTSFVEEDAQGHDLAPFSGDMNQSEKNSDIKLPLSEAGLAACRLLFCRSKLLRF